MKSTETILNILNLIRVKQWIKNVFVFAPLLFSFTFKNANLVFNSVLAFFTFCFIASFVYIINDIFDYKEDILHPHKKDRPIASGKISVNFAMAISILCLILASLCLNKIDMPKVTVIALVYIIINLLYSYKLKRIPLLDVAIISVGFLLRIYMGALVVQTYVSGFIFMTTLFLSLFLGFMKRKSELISSGINSRQVLNFYPNVILTKFILVSAALTIASYTLYTIAPTTIKRLGTPNLMYSALLVILGMFRYYYVLDKNFYNNDDPTENIYKDKWLQSICILYVIYLIIILSGKF